MATTTYKTKQEVIFHDRAHQRLQRLWINNRNTILNNVQTDGFTTRATGINFVLPV